MKKQFQNKLDLINEQSKIEKQKIQEQLENQFDAEIVAQLQQKQREIDEEEQIPYRSDTSSEDLKYKTDKNKKFKKKSKQWKKNHILRLWRTAFNRTKGAIFIIQFYYEFNYRTEFFGKAANLKGT